MRAASLFTHHQEKAAASPHDSAESTVSTHAEQRYSGARMGPPPVIDHSQGRRKRNISIQPASTICGSPREKEADLVALTALCTPKRGGAFATSWLPLPKTCRLRTGTAFAQGEDVARQSGVLPRPEECAVSQGRSSQDLACRPR